MYKFFTSKKGFTIVELIIVLLLLSFGVLALANMFKEYKLNLISSTQINSITDSFISQNRAKGVTLYEDRYSDLITGEETEDEHAGHNH